MPNIIDLALAALILFYLLKHAGGIMATAKNIVIVILLLVVFGVVVRLSLDLSFISGAARSTLESSYLVGLSYNIIKWGYPAVETNAPKLNSFIKDKIISGTTQEVTIPKITLPEKKLPKVNILDDNELFKDK